MNRWIGVIAAVGAVLAAGLPGGAGEPIAIPLDIVDGIGGLTGSCFIRGIRLSSEPADGMTPPSLEGVGRYGVLRLGDGTVPIALDVGGTAITLYVDEAGDGDLAAIEWERVLPDGTLLARPTFWLVYEGSDARVPYRMHVMWNPYAPALITYCRDTYRAGEAVFDGRPVRVAVIDEDSDGRYDPPERGTLLVDVDGDGEWLATADSHERYDLSEPFWLGDAIYEVAAVARDGSWIQVSPSLADVPRKHPLIPGYPAPPFETVDAGGMKISIESLRGRIVVLDFWAGWCTPCVVELPNLLRVARELGGRGVEVIGINVDRSEAAFRAAVAEHGIDYPQIYDGPDGPIARIYRVDGIPKVYLLDRDGVIRGRDLRGSALFDAVEALLEEDQ